MDFYKELQLNLEKGIQGMETVLILTGKMAGEKRLARDGENLSFPEEVRIFRERVSCSPKMIICGGGHVSMPVIAIGKMVGFQVTVLEDRPKFADCARKEGADRVICAPYEKALAEEKLDEDTYVVIVTRGHRYDSACLYSVLDRKEECAYVGMMGSRRRTAIVKEQMIQMGISQERVDKVCTPIGLAIGAETPEEIAVSILGEIIEVKNKKQSKGGYSEELLDGILETRENGEEAVLATIVSRKGSAPRSVGTKMLILKDGRQIGTIGGGCAESEILQKSRQMLSDEKDGVFRLVQVDMTADQAEEEGMVCGGTIEVALEKIVSV